MARKEEVENVIASEISQLSLKLQQERDIEIDREVWRKTVFQIRFGWRFCRGESVTCLRAIEAI